MTPDREQVFDEGHLYGNDRVGCSDAAQNRTPLRK